MKKLRYSCILFDLDGTVVDTVADCRAAVNKAMEKFSFPTHTDDEVRSYLNDGARMLIKRALPENVRENEALVDRVLSYYKEQYTVSCTVESRVYDGILQMLDELKELGAVLGIVTNKPDETTKVMIPYYFGDRFSFVEGNSAIIPPKPDSSRVMRAAEFFDKNISDVLFVGDSHVDVKTAHNAGCDCVGVLWGFAGKNAFVERCPEYVVNSPELITKIAAGELPKGYYANSD